jgi:hypothetical protein
MMTQCSFADASAALVREVTRVPIASRRDLSSPAAQAALSDEAMASLGSLTSDTASGGATHPDAVRVTPTPARKRRRFMFEIARRSLMDTILLLQLASVITGISVDRQVTNGAQTVRPGTIVVRSLFQSHIEPANRSGDE